MGFTRGIAARALVIGVLSSTAAWAQTDVDEAEYARAAPLRATDPDAALVIYRQLHERTHSPRALAQIGVVEAQMGRWVPAEEHLAAALEVRADTWIEARRPALEANLAQIRAHVSVLTVVANVVGATLRVNDVPAGVLPLPSGLHVAVGQVVIDLDADGYEHVRETAQATPGTTRIEVAMVRAAPRVIAAPSPPVAPAVVASTPVVAAPAINATLRAIGFATMGAGVVGIVIGVVGVTARNGHVSTFGAYRCWIDGATVHGGTTACQDEYSAGTGAESMSTAGFVVGASLLVAGAALTITSAVLGTSRQRASLTCAPDLFNPGVRCGASF